MHYYTDMCIIAEVTETSNVPISVAARKGVSALAEMAEDSRVALTSHGRVVAVVDSPERVDAEVRAIREAAWAVLETAADLAAGRGRRYTLDELCMQVGVDADHVRERSAQLRTAADAR